MPRNLSPRRLPKVVPSTSTTAIVSHRVSPRPSTISARHSGGSLGPVFQVVKKRSVSRPGGVGGGHVRGTRSTLAPIDGADGPMHALPRVSPLPAVAKSGEGSTSSGRRSLSPPAIGYARKSPSSHRRYSNREDRAAAVMAMAENADAAKMSERERQRQKHQER